MNFWMSYGFMLMCVVAAVALAIGGLLIVRRFASHETLAGHHEVAGPFFSTIGTLYAVVLGFIVVGALNTFQQAQAIVEKEANAFHQIFHLANGLSDPIRTDIRKACYNYADAMVTYEWNTMEYGQSSPEGSQIYQRLWHDVCRYQPTNASENTFLSAVLNEMEEAGDARHNRLMQAKSMLDPIIWCVLALSTIATVVFTYFFGVEKLKVQILMTALVTVVVTLNLVIVALYDSPFSGDVKVSPQPFVADVNYFKNEINSR